jgi:hypothetical protein
MEDTGSDGFSLDRVLQFLAARLIVENAQVDGLVSSVKCAGGPFHKLCEVEEKRGLHLVLLSAALGAGRLHCARTKQYRAEQHNDLHRHAGSPAACPDCRIGGYAMQSCLQLKKTT